MSFDFISSGKRHIQKASEADKEGDLPVAFKHYCLGIEHLTRALKYDKIESRKEIIRQKLNEYMDRAEQIKKHLKKQQQATQVAAASTTKGLSNSTEVIDLDGSPPSRNKVGNTLQKALESRIVAQSFAIAAVSQAIKRAESGWNDEDSPLVWLFLGTSGVGKTELAKALAHALFEGNENAEKGFIRVDMSEFQDKTSVNKFLGAPPGYVGFSEGSQLTDSLMECPDAVVLLDEIEKAHPDVLTILLQLFDEGRITNNKGVTIHCKDAIFIMTSNLASEEISKLGGELRKDFGKKKGGVDSLLSAEEKLVRSVEPVLKAHFKRDEFIGRISEIVPFLPFTKKDVFEIVRRLLQKWKRIAMARHEIQLVWNDNVVEVLAKGYNDKYGVRSVKNLIEKKVVTELANATLAGKIGKKSKVMIEIEKGESGPSAVKITKVG